MLKHCQIPIKLGLEKREIKPNKIIILLFGKRIIRNLVATKDEFKKNSPTFKEAKNLTTVGFESEKRNLYQIQILYSPIY